VTLYEVALKVALPNSFYADITRRFPSMSIFIWCNRENDVVEVVVRNPEDYPLVMKEFHARPIMGVIEEISDDRRLYLNVRECHCMKQDTIVRHHRLVVFRHKDLEELLRRFDNWGWVYKILRKVPFDGFIASSLTLTADALFSGLTERQMAALITAHRHGYYNLPRDSDVQTIAAKEKVPRTTFQEHLKKAENKLVGALMPHMQLFNHASPEKRQSLRVK